MPDQTGDTSGHQYGGQRAQQYDKKLSFFLCDLRNADPSFAASPVHGAGNLVPCRPMTIGGGISSVLRQVFAPCSVLLSKDAPKLIGADEFSLLGNLVLPCTCERYHEGDCL
jgi:hypothetical protein